MANYTLTPPISTTQINLYPSGGGSFAVNIKGSSSLATNTTFPLPSTTGSTGSFLAYNGSSSTWISGAINSGAQLPINLSFGALFSSTLSTTYVILGEVYFQGTSVVGTPSAINVLVGGSPATNANVRVNDRTNAVIIGTSATFTTGTPFQIISIPITGALSTGGAIWDIQVRTTSGALNLRGFQVLP